MGSVNPRNLQTTFTFKQKSSGRGWAQQTRYIAARLIQLQFLFNLRPGDARFAAIGAFGAFNGPGILDVFDGAAHLAQQGFGLNQLLVELRPVARRFGCQSGVTHLRSDKNRLVAARADGNNRQFRAGQFSNRL